MDIKAIQKAAEDKIDLITSTSIEVMELIAKAAWNEAIEAVAQSVENRETAVYTVDEIRKLKK